MSSNPRQTFTYLRNLFSKRRISPNKRFGQNFLIDLNIHDLIVNTAELSDRDVVLEVGPGTGALTAKMAERASAVVAVEIDTAMALIAQETVRDRPNVRVLNMDALAGKHKLNPYVIDNLRAGLAMGPEKRLKLVANLPYNVATPIITNLLMHAELRPVLMVITIQKELADRMMARPQTSDYGSLSAIVQAVADVELVRVLSPKVFWPQPKVDSAVVKITPNPEKRAAIDDLPWFHHVVRELFLLRRKNLRGALYSRFKPHWTGKADVDALLDSLGLVGEVRAEAMDVSELLALSVALKQRFGDEATRLQPANHPDSDDEDDENEDDDATEADDD